MSLNAPNASPASAHGPDAQGWVTCGTLRVKGGAYGTDFLYYPDVFQYPKEDGTIINYGFVGYSPQETADLVLVLTDKPLTVANAEGTNTTDPTAANAAATCLWIAPGNHADVTLAGVCINGSMRTSIPINILTNIAGTADGTWAKSGSAVRNRTSLHLTLADGTNNYLSTLSWNLPGIRCGEGSSLTIDDEERNVDANGNEVVPVGAVINQDVRLASGKQLKKGDPHTVLDSANPGTLDVRGARQAAAIGGACEETGGAMTFNGGVVTARAWTGGIMLETGAGIGGGTWGCGTDGIITFNSGTVDALGNYHSSGIGSGSGAKSEFGYDRYIAPDHIPCKARQNGDWVFIKGWYYGTDVRAGSITINGGFVKSTGYEHSSGFGNSCASSPNTGGVIRITGGTLYPTVTSSEGFPDFNAEGGHVVITGGSVYTNGSFKGIGDTAWGNDAALAPGYDPSDPEDDNKVFMVTIDLSADMAAAGEAGDNLIEDWSLKVGGEDYPYGAPTRLIDGKLYLWLPKSATQQTVSVDLSYRGKDGQAHPFDTLFRNPGQADQLKRYEDFELPKEYLDSLVKPYDGLPFETYEITPEHPLRTPEVLSYDKDGNPAEYRWLTNTDDVTYRYRLYDKRGGSPVGDEVDSGKDMPVDVGVMKFTMVSREYSGSSDPALADFANGYWGHRATGWCEITPIPSKVSLLSAEWAEESDADKRPGAVEHPATSKLRVTAEVRGGTFPDGTPTADTCKAPQGSFQLYVDGKPVGPVTPIRYTAGVDDEGNPVPANATAVPNPADGRGSLARIEFEVTPADDDLLFPEPGKENTHVVSMRFLPPDEAQQKAGAVANYLASASPADDPGAAPKVEVAITPLDPNPTVTPEPDPDCKDPDFPEPDVETGAGEPADPDADPGKPGDKAFHGTITTTWGEPTADNPHPGRVTLKLSTPSSAPVSVTDAEGNVFEADFVRDADGNPVRGEDGSYTLVLDPVAVGRGELTFRQEPNGIYTGSTWVYDVIVRPQPKIAPAPALSKKAKNLTHPDGPTQPGDRIRYTVTASNGAAGSLWTDVVVTDPLPTCLELDGGSVRLDNPSGGVEDRALSKAPAVAASDVGRFSLSAAGANGRPVLTVPAGDVGGGQAAVVTFECTVREGLDLSDPAVVDLANVASATGRRPNPDDPDGPDVGPVSPPDTPPAAPPGGTTVTPADPGEGDVSLAKSVENLSALGAEVTRLGDRLRYTVTLRNDGPADSALWDAVISDPLPAGIEPLGGTLTLTGPLGAAGERVVAVPDGAYDRATRTIAVAAGDLWGGQAWTLSFECEVTADALGADVANVAFAHGTPPSEDPGHDPSDPGAEPGEPATPPSPDDDPAASSPPAEPAPVIPDDPAEGDVAIDKTAENTSRDDGTTRVGDVVRYEVALRVDGIGAGWMDAVIRDEVPRGLEPLSGTIRLALPGGGELAVDDGAYDPATRVLAVAVGHLYGGQEARLSFDALVTADALGADVGNVAEAYGTPPSAWDPDGAHPGPGAPFSPPGGWDAWARGHDKVASDPAAYPPGAGAQGGVLPGDGGADEGRTIRHARLAQTGDALAALAGAALACALAAGSALLASRRRSRA